MRARVQYNDCMGTAAADGDFSALDNWLEEQGVDINQYQVIGVKIDSGYNDFFSIEIHCIDKEKTIDADNPHIVSIDCEDEIDRDMLFELFKRFEVVIYRDEKYLNFDIELAKKQTNENPVFYVQYVHARIASIFRAAEGKFTPAIKTDAQNLAKQAIVPHDKHSFCSGA